MALAVDNTLLIAADLCDPTTSNAKVAKIERGVPAAVDGRSAV